MNSSGRWPKREDKLKVISVEERQNTFTTVCRQWNYVTTDLHLRYQQWKRYTAYNRLITLVDSKAAKGKETSSIWVLTDNSDSFLASALPEYF